MSKDTIGSMTAVVRATAGLFKADMDAIERSVHHAKGAFSGLGDLKFGAALGAGIAAAQGAIHSLHAAFEKMHESIKGGERLAEFADQVGATTRELQELRFAAGQVGSSGDELDAAMQKMQQAIGKALLSGKDEDPFERLGLSADELSRKTAGGAFRDIADKFKEINNPAIEAGMAIEIFGKKGAGMLNLLRQGSEEFDKLGKQARDLGGVMGGSQIEGFRETEDALDRLGTAWNGVWNQITSAVTAWDKLVESGFLNGGKKQTGLIDAASQFTAGLANVPKALGEFVAEGVFGSDAVAQAKRSMKMAEQIQAEIAAGGIGAMNEALAKGGDEGKEAQKAFNKELEEAAKIIEGLRDPFEIYQDTINDLSEKLQAGMLDWLQYSKAIEQASDKLDKATESHDELKRLTQTQGTGAAIAGTSAGFSAVESSRRLQADIERQQVTLQQKQLEEAKKQTNRQERIEQALIQGFNGIQATE